MVCPTLQEYFSNIRPTGESRNRARHDEGLCRDLVIFHTDTSFCTQRPFRRRPQSDISQKNSFSHTQMTLNLMKPEERDFIALPGTVNITDDKVNGCVSLIYSPLVSGSWGLENTEFNSEMECQSDAGYSAVERICYLWGKRWLPALCFKENIQQFKGPWCLHEAGPLGKEEP